MMCTVGQTAVSMYSAFHLLKRPLYPFPRCFLHIPVYGQCASQNCACVSQFLPPRQCAPLARQIDAREEHHSTAMQDLQRRTSELHQKQEEVEALHKGKLAELAQANAKEFEGKQRSLLETLEQELELTAKKEEAAARDRHESALEKVKQDLQRDHEQVVAWG